MKKYIIKNETQTVMPAIRKEALLTILHYGRIEIPVDYMVNEIDEAVYQISKLQNSL